MESKVEETVDISDIARNDNHDGFDFRKQLLEVVENEWSVARTNNLDKKKKPKKNGNVGKKGVRNFRSVDMLNECILEDQTVVDEQSEMIKTNRKHEMQEFITEHEKIMKEKGHCKKDGKLDGSMKAHCRRFFTYFDTAMHGNSDKNYFDIVGYKTFLQNKEED